MKKIFIEAHKMTREMKESYPEVDYQTQFGLFVSYLLEEKKEEERKMKKQRINVVGDKYVTLSEFIEVETSRGILTLPTIVVDEDMNIKKEVSYNVWENYGKVRIYINDLGRGGYIEILKDGSTKTVERAQYAVEERMQEAIGLFAENKGRKE